MTSRNDGGGGGGDVDYDVNILRTIQGILVKDDQGDYVFN